MGTTGKTSQEILNKLKREILNLPLGSSEVKRFSFEVIEREESQSTVPAGNVGMVDVGRAGLNIRDVSQGIQGHFSGVAFLSMASIMVGPFFHRFLHWFHLEF